MSKISKNKTAIVTGATGNLGQAVVRKFISEGCYVIGTTIPGDDTDPGFPEDAFEKIIVDLTNEEQTGNMVKDMIEKHGSLDAAVLTAGGFAMGKIGETGIADIGKQYRLNFETAYNIARPVFTHMIKQHNGRIFMIGSRPGLSSKHGKGMVAYSLTKSLIFRLAELMNDEAKETNVVVSVIVPSTIDTPQNRKAMPDSDPGKWVTPEAIAEVIWFYCSDQSAALREPVIKVYNQA